LKGLELLGRKRPPASESTGRTTIPAGAIRKINKNAFAFPSSNHYCTFS
jgi:hypothetical protein